MQRNCNLLSHAAQSLSPIFLTLTTTARNPIDLYLSNLSHSNGSQVFQPCNDLWYLPKICSRISKICLCISISNSKRWSRNIVMMSRWFAFKRTSSSKGRSHSMRTSIVCTIRKILVTFSNPTIQSMYRSFIASRNGRLSRLSILGIDYVAILSLSLNATIPTHTPVVSQLLLSKTSRPVIGVSTVQTPHLCLQDLLPTSASQDILNVHLQVGCRSLHCPNTSLVSPGLTPNLSLSRYSKHSKTMSSPAINWQVTFNQWPHSQHAKSETKTHIIWIKNTQALRCPWLYIRNVPT